MVTGHRIWWSPAFFDRLTRLRMRLRHWPIAAAVLCALLIWQPIFVGSALAYNDEIFSSALKVFVALRAINAALSVVKETEIGFEFVGSVTAQPAMVFDPVDEMVARVADYVFLLATLSGILSFAAVPFAQLGAAVAAGGFAIVAAAGIWPLAERIAAAGRTLAAIGLVFALALPVGYGVGGWLAERVTQAELGSAIARLEGNAETLQTLAETTQQTTNAEPSPPDSRRLAGPADENGFLGSLTGPVLEMFDQAGTATSDMARGVADRFHQSSDAIRDVLPDMAEVEARGTEILESSLIIIAIYAFRLIVFPLVLLWLLVAVTRRTIAGGANR